jgi:hypothetical protein
MKISSHQFVDNIQEQFAKFTSDKPLEIAAALTFLWGIGGTPCSHCAPMPQLTPARRQCDQCRPRKRRGRPPHLRVHGTANLFVTDASVFPIFHNGHRALRNGIAQTLRAVSGLDLPNASGNFYVKGDVTDAANDT